MAKKLPATQAAPAPRQTSNGQATLTPQAARAIGINHPPEKDQLHLIFYQTDDDMIDRDTVADIRRLLDAEIKRPPQETEIDIWINSGGGDAHSTFKLYRDLRSRCSVLRAVVPDFAKSAATLLSIGCDHIFAAPSTDFGPLDVQIRHPDREDKIVSSLAGANSAEHLANLGVNLMLATGKRIIDLTQLPRGEVIKHVLLYSSDILKPVLSKLDPQLIHEAAEQLKVTRQYAEILLKSLNKPMSEHAAREVSRKLVTQYPTHGYVIDLQELRRLGIQCSPLADHPLAARISKFHDDFVTNAAGSVIKLIRIQPEQKHDPSSSQPEAPHETVN